MASLKPLYHINHYFAKNLQIKNEIKLQTTMGKHSKNQSNNTKLQHRCKRRRKIKIKMPHKARRVKSQTTKLHHTTPQAATCLPARSTATTTQWLQSFDCRGNSALTRRACPIYDPNKVAALQLTSRHPRDTQGCGACGTAQINPHIYSCTL